MRCGDPNELLDCSDMVQPCADCGRPAEYIQIIPGYGAVPFCKRCYEVDAISALAKMESKESHETSK